jgi:ubiquinone/menaquinone biosynthesis C-methylase UbiE
VPPSDDELERVTAREADLAFARRVRTVMRWLPAGPGVTLLDVPCGQGFYIERYAAVAGDTVVIGVDADHRLNDVASRVPGGAGRVITGAIEQLPFPDASFDGAYACEVLEHVDDDVAALREVVRTVRPGGLIAVTVPNANYPILWDPINWVLERATRRRRHVRSGRLAGIWAGHVRLYRPEQLRHVVVAAGLDVVEERSFTHHCVPFAHNLVYGLGKPILERRLLPRSITDVGDRHAVVDAAPAPWWNPLVLALGLLRFPDRWNRDDEPPDRSTVSLAVLARVPSRGRTNVRP